MARTYVGVLRGGTSHEYPFSLKTGAAVIAALPEERYEVRDIFIDKSGMWHARGIPTDPSRALAQVDVVFNALHGSVGEDGTVQRIVEQLGIPYAGARPMPASFSLNKFYTRELARQAGMRVAQGVMFNHMHPLNTGEMARAVFHKFAPPYIVKPVNQGASHGIRFAPTIVELPDAIGDVLDEFGAALVEEFIIGHDVSVGVIENFRDNGIYALPAVHVLAPPGEKFITHNSIAESKITHVVPSSFSDAEKRALAQAARLAHSTIGLSHFSEADFRLTPRGPILLEVNAIPHLYTGSPFASALEAVGSSVLDFAEHAISLAMGR